MMVIAIVVLGASLLYITMPPEQMGIDESKNSGLRSGGWS